MIRKSITERDLEIIHAGGKVYFPGPYFKKTKWRSLNINQYRHDGKPVLVPRGECYTNGQLYFAYLPFLYLFAANNPSIDILELEAEFYKENIIEDYGCYTSLSELYNRRGGFIGNRLSLAASALLPEQLPDAIRRVLCCANELIIIDNLKARKTPLD